MKNKSFKGFMWLIIILIVLIMFVISLVFYKNFFLDNKIYINNETTSSIITNSTKKKETLTHEEIENYLTYVPFGLIKNDAYQGNNMNISTIDKASMLFVIYNNCDFGTVFSFNDENCEKGFCVKEDAFNQRLKEFYNVDISYFDIKNDNVNGWKEIEEYLILKNGYYFTLGGNDGNRLKSSASNVTYEISEDVLIINEQIGIILGNYEGVYVYNGDNLIVSYEYMDDGENSIHNFYQDAENYVKDNLKDFNTYKHTFKQHEDGTYYWYSTEVAEIQN